MKKGSLWKALLWFIFGFVFGFLVYKYYVAAPKYVGATTKVTICHCQPKKQCKTLKVTRKSALAHLKQHKKDYRGRCVKPKPTPTPTVTPTPTATPTSTPAPKPVVRDFSGPYGFTPVCYGSTHPVIPWASAERNGTNALIKYVPTTGEGDVVNVVFSENPFEIVFGLGSHGLRDWRPNVGHLELHDLVAGQSYWFRIANGCSRWSGIFFIPAR